MTSYSIFTLASKICPSCGAKNPSSVYICTNCAASLLEVDSPSLASQMPVSSSSKITKGFSEQSYPVASQAGRQIGATPIAIVQQSPLGSILNALGSIIYLLIFGIGAGIAFGGQIVSIAIIVAVVVVPVVLGYVFRPKYEFYDSELVRVSRSGQRQMDYSQMKSVTKSRSRIVIALQEDDHEFRRGRIVIPGNPKLPDGMDLSTWLEARVPQPQVKERDETRTNEANS